MVAAPLFLFAAFAAELLFALPARASRGSMTAPEVPAHGGLHSLATPAVARDSLILRTLTKLYRIANSSETKEL
jgi:hypothetical protein